MEERWAGEGRLIRKGTATMRWRRGEKGERQGLARKRAKERAKERERAYFGSTGSSRAVRVGLTQGRRKSGDPCE